MERLESRLVLSTIQWVNRGATSDRFDDVFDSDATAARAVVDTAIDHWERVIVDFNYPGGGNTFQANISMSPSGTDRGGAAQVTRYNSADQPDQGTLSLGRGNDSDGDGRGDGGGWYLDPNPRDWAEFDGEITNAFTGVADDGAPPVGLSDFYSVIVHEMGHFLGFTGGQHRFNDLATNTGIVDTSRGGNGFYYVFDGPSIQHALTSINGGNDGGSAIHSAATGTNFLYNGTNYRGGEDMMNWFTPFTRTRRLIPDTVALMLKDAYGYTIELPQKFGTYQAMLNESTGELWVRGGNGDSDDTISLEQFGGTITVSVDLGNDIPGTGALPGVGDLPPFVSEFNASNVSHIQIDAGDGDDVIQINATDRFWSITPTVSVNGQDGFDVLSIFDDGFSGAGDYFVTYNEVADSFNNAVVYDGMEGVNLFAGDGSNHIQIESTANGTPVNVFAGGGDDLFEVASISRSYFLSSRLSLYGEQGVDDLIVYDDGFFGNGFYQLYMDRIVDGFNSEIYYSELESVTLYTSQGHDTVNVIDTGAPTWVFLGDGQDLVEVNPVDQVFNLDANLFIDGEGDVDRLVVHDESFGGSIGYGVTSSRVSDSFGNQVDYVNLEQVTLNSGAGEAAVTVSDTSPGTPVWVNTGAGNDLVSVWTTSFAADVTVNMEDGLNELRVGVPNNSARVRIAESQTFSRVSIEGDSRLTIEAGLATLIETRLLELSPLARLDLNYGGVLIDYSETGISPMAFVAQKIRDARNLGTPPWSYPGITSSVAAADPVAFGVGYAEASRVLPSGGTFLGAVVPPGAEYLLLRLARNGDANLDGAVDLSDLHLWNANRLIGPTDWSTGDFNGDGVTDVLDFDLWNINKFQNGPSPTSPVPTLSGRPWDNDIAQVTSRTATRPVPGRPTNDLQEDSMVAGSTDGDHRDLGSVARLPSLFDQMPSLANGQGWRSS